VPPKMYTLRYSVAYVTFVAILYEIDRINCCNNLLCNWLSAILLINCVGKKL